MPNPIRSWLDTVTRRVARLATCALLLGAASAGANPIIDGYITLDTVIVMPPPNFTNIYDETHTLSWNAVIVSPSYGSARLQADIYWDYVEYVASIKLNPYTKPDVRCNPNATEASKQTTSKSDPTDRYMAAHQVFSAINVWDSAKSLRGLMRDNTTYFFNGRKRFTFQITYADAVVARPAGPRHRRHPCKSPVVAMPHQEIHRFYAKSKLHPAPQSGRT